MELVCLRAGFWFWVEGSLVKGNVNKDNRTINFEDN